LNEKNLTDFLNFEWKKINGFQNLNFLLKLENHSFLWETAKNKGFDKWISFMYKLICKFESLKNTKNKENIISNFEKIMTQDIQHKQMHKMLIKTIFLINHAHSKYSVQFTKITIMIFSVCIFTNVNSTSTENERIKAVQTYCCIANFHVTEIVYVHTDVKFWQKLIVRNKIICFLWKLYAKNYIWCCDVRPFYFVFIGMKYKLPNLRFLQRRSQNWILCMEKNNRVTRGVIFLIFFSQNRFQIEIFFLNKSHNPPWILAWLFANIETQHHIHHLNYIFTNYCIVTKVCISIAESWKPF